MSNCCPASPWLTAHKGLLVHNRRQDYQIRNFVAAITPEEYQQLQHNCRVFAQTFLAPAQWQAQWQKVLAYFNQSANATIRAPKTS